MTPPFEPGDLVQCTWHTLDELRVGIVVSAERAFYLTGGFWYTVLIDGNLIRFDAGHLQRWSAE
jgi:hypothetical protein